jgi:hypothetical protein
MPSIRTIITKPPEIFYKNALDGLNTLEEQEKWLSEKMSSNSKILEFVKDKIETFDKMDPDSEECKKMKNTK